MQKRIADIRREIVEHPARSAWDRGCRAYAEELFSEYIENLQIKNEKVRIGKIAEADLLNGADSWEQYSYGGCALIYDSDICERLCTEKEAQRKRYAHSPPSHSASHFVLNRATFVFTARMAMERESGMWER